MKNKFNHTDYFTLLSTDGTYSEEICDCECAIFELDHEDLAKLSKEWIDYSETDYYWIVAIYTFPDNIKKQTEIITFSGTYASVKDQVWEHKNVSGGIMDFSWEIIERTEI